MRRILPPIFCLLLSFQAFTQVIYVAADATGANDGTSWQDAYTDLQSALAGTGGEVWVKAGTYYPTSGTDRGISFVLNRDIYGGFNGTETVRNQRDFRVNETILSGNIGDPNDNADNTSLIVDAVNIIGSGNPGLLDGFTIRDANSTGVSGYSGGNTSHTVSNCLFTNLIGGNGALDINHPSNISSDIKIIGCTFRFLSGIRGINFRGNGKPQTNVEIVNNLIYDTDAGGISAPFVSGLIVNNTIVNTRGTGINIAFNSSIDVYNNILTGNQTEFSEGLATFNLTNNIIQGTTDPNNFDIDPGFIDVGNNDYRLSSCSAARDIGNGSLLPASVTEDLEGNARTFGTQVDPGAYEISVDPLSSNGFQVTDAECVGEDSGKITFDISGGNGPLQYSVDGGTTYFNSSIGEVDDLVAGTYNLVVRDQFQCELIVANGVVISEPTESSKTPSITGTTTPYGTPSTSGLVIALDPTDNVTEFFGFPTVSSAFGNLFKSDGVTQINSGDFITLAEANAGLIYVPTTSGNIATFSLRAATKDRFECAGGGSAAPTINVTDAPLTASARTQTISYGQSPDLTIDYDGFVLGEDETVLVNPVLIATTATNTSLPGSYPINVTSQGDNNYVITDVDGTVTITNAPLEVTPNNKTITYGDAFPSFDGTLSGVVNGENITATYATLANGNTAGAFEISASLNDPDGSLVNYDVTNTPGTLTINQAPLTVTGNSDTITYGEPLPVFDGTLSGVVNSDNITASFSSNNDSGLAGTFEITATLNDPEGRLSNYDVTNIPGNLTINKANLVVSARRSITFGEAIPTLTASYTGFVNGEDAKVIEMEPSIITTDASEGSDVGTYTITISEDAEDNNYKFSYQTGTLTITPAEAAINLSNLVQEEDGTVKEPMVVTSPEGLNFILSFDDLEGFPVSQGSYPFTVRIDELNYQGVARDTLLITEDGSGVLSVSSQKVDIDIYPNPATKSVNVLTNTPGGLHMFDVQGVLVRAVLLESGQATLDLNGLKKGIYLLKVSHGGDVHVIKRLIID